MKRENWELSPPEIPAGGIGKLVAAAIVDQDFCHRLLADPLAAAHDGFLSETFPLTHEEEVLLLSVQNPLSLSDFAKQVIKNYNTPRRY